jgi:hypothetical protein
MNPLLRLVELEVEGVEKFAASYRSLLAAIEAKIGQLV